MKFELQLLPRPDPKDLLPPDTQRRGDIFDHVMSGLTDSKLKIHRRGDGGHTQVECQDVTFVTKLIVLTGHDPDWVVSRWLYSVNECPCNYCEKYGVSNWWHLFIDINDGHGIIETLDCGIFKPRDMRRGPRGHRTWNVVRSEEDRQMGTRRHR